MICDVLYETGITLDVDQALLESYATIDGNGT